MSLTLCILGKCFPNAFGMYLGIESFWGPFIFPLALLSSVSQTLEIGGVTFCCGRASGSKEALAVVFITKKAVN